jgi:predicted ATP-grasp superfamily ATP-dependent carboligase
MTLDVLLTDSSYKHTYAALRALKMKNLKVGIICNSRLSISYLSRYVDKRFMVECNISAHPDENTIYNFKEEVLAILKKNKISVIIPVGNISYYVFSKYENEISKYTKIVVAEKNIMSVAQNKYSTFLLAKSKNIPIPRTFFPADFEDLINISNKIIFPCVIKRTNFDESGVLYCNNKEEYIKNINSNFKGPFKCDITPPIIQEYIQGEAYGFFALFNQGKCLHYFMHKRIHEYPVTGGPSSLAESIYDENLFILGKKILETFNWHGLAMVEFKKDVRDNQYKLIEINPKLWGSLELSLTAGINFPYLTYLLALNQISEESDYRREVFFRWVIPEDLLWLHFAEPNRRAEFRNFRNKVRFINNIHIDDPLPIIYNILLFFKGILRDKKYPNGLIKV